MTFNTLNTALSQGKTIELCVRNSQKKEEWFPVEEIDEQRDVQDYRITALSKQLTDRIT